MLNKTLKGNAKKIKLAHKALPALVLAVFIALIGITRPPVLSVETCNGVEISGNCTALEYAETNKSRAQGLSGRVRLAPSSGMLFVFDKSMEECMWMKDMHFAIDIIWLDKNQRITKIMESVDPSTYPESFCADNTKYVLELNANEAHMLGLTVGQQIDL